MIRFSLNVTLSLALVFGLVAYLRANPEVYQSLEGAHRLFNLEIIASLFFLAYLNQFLKSWRLQILLGQTSNRSALRVPKLSLQYLTAYHSAVSNILPGKLGELALPMLLKRDHEMGYARGAGVLFYIRGYDFFFVTSLFIVSAQFANLGDTWDLALRLAFFPMAMGIWFLYRFDHFAQILRWFSRVVPVRFAIQKVIEDLLSPLVTSLSPAQRGVFFVLTLGIWTANYLGFYLICRVFELWLPPFDFLLAAASTTLTFVLPITGLANAGPMEAAWAWILQLCGHDFQKSLAVCIVIHGASVGLGVLIVLVLGVIKKALVPQSPS